MPRYLSFSFYIYFLCYVLLCFVLTSPPLMMCVYLQTFEAALFLEEEINESILEITVMTL